MSTTLFDLPKDLPRPADDGAASHLCGMSLPTAVLPATNGANIELAAIPGRSVIYIYPMTGRPGVPLPDGWDGIPGARGCTPQSCSFRDHYHELKALNTSVFGLSTTDHRVSERSTRPFASALRIAERQRNLFEAVARFTHLYRGGDGTIQALDAHRREQPNSEGVLPGFSTRPER
jgi:Redoxin